MDRRSFMRQAAVTTLGALALPVASALSLLSGSRPAMASTAEVEEDLRQLTEEEIVELTLNYADSYQELLPGVDIRRALLRHLQRDSASRTS